MTHVEEHVRLRTPCPCGKGEVLLKFRPPLTREDTGVFLPPSIVCAVCVSRYGAHYLDNPDRVELFPLEDESPDAPPERSVIYQVKPVPRSRDGWVDHA